MVVVGQMAADVCGSWLLACGLWLLPRMTSDRSIDLSLETRHETQVMAREQHNLRSNVHMHGSCLFLPHFPCPTKRRNRNESKKNKPEKQLVRSGCWISGLCAAIGNGGSSMLIYDDPLYIAVCETKELTASSASWTAFALASADLVVVWS